MTATDTRHILDSRVGQRVKVHLNLHRGDWSVSEIRTGTVLCNVTDITLRDVTFRVSPSMRERVIRTKRRKVHAWAYGTVTSFDASPDVTGQREVSYNPYAGPTFYIRDDANPVTELPVVTFTGRYGYTPR